MHVACEVLEPFFHTTLRFPSFPEPCPLSFLVCSRRSLFGRAECSDPILNLSQVRALPRNSTEVFFDDLLCIRAYFHLSALWRVSSDKGSHTRVKSNNVIANEPGWKSIVNWTALRKHQE
jgi:hypothetical protein